jgi:hypothetical protein
MREPMTFMTEWNCPDYDMASGKQELTTNFRAEKNLLEMFQNSTADVEYSFFGRHFKDVQRVHVLGCVRQKKAINSAFPFWKYFKNNKKILMPHARFNIN